MSSLGIAVVLQGVVEGLDLLLEADALLLAEELGMARDNAQIPGLPHQHSLQDIRILIKGGIQLNNSRFILYNQQSYQKITSVSDPHWIRIQSDQ